MISRYGISNLLYFSGQYSVASVYDNSFFFCSTLKHSNYCFYINPLESGKKRIYEARGRIRYSQGQRETRRHISHSVSIQTMEERNLDWTDMTFEDPLWSHEFYNETHGIDPEIGTNSQSFSSLPYEAVINDFCPVVGLGLKNIHFH
ncbi:unnamed protein product [Oikopleura dioica]|uniref:Uncharacterized protein n=1 Tax=Oikopleura dioica TaxID=34765 RepID=E4Y3Y4_OIKDI|nr:unnamed protein product [Oikopleura dioica]